jgi:hypothetical protein
MIAVRGCFFFKKFPKNTYGANAVALTFSISKIPHFWGTVGEFFEIPLSTCGAKTKKPAWRGLFGVFLNLESLT